MSTIKFLLLFIFIAVASCSKAQKNNTFSINKQYNVENNIAIQGYDPVAYFSKNKALIGNKAFAVSHQGVTYYFATLEHKSTFLKSPSQYEPQFGGWCAYAMGNTGDKVEIDPETFKIVNGKLFLFYHSLLNNTLKLWNKNESDLLPKAYINWTKIASKK